MTKRKPLKLSPEGCTPENCNDRHCGKCPNCLLDKTRMYLGLLLDCCDYTEGACRIHEQVGAIIPRDILLQAKAVKDEANKYWIPK